MARRSIVRSRSPKRRRGGAARLAVMPVSRYRFDNLLPMRVPCAAFVCGKFEILQFNEAAKPALVTSVTGPKGQEIDKVKKKKLRDELIGQVFPPGDPNPEKKWPKTISFNFCPAGCTCREAAIVMSPPEDATHVFEFTISRKPPGAKPGALAKEYKIKVEIKVKRKVGFVNCQ